MHHSSPYQQPRHPQLPFCFWLESLYSHRHYDLSVDTSKERYEKKLTLMWVAWNPRPLELLKHRVPPVLPWVHGFRSFRY